MGKDEKAELNGQEGNTLREKRFSAGAERVLRSAQAAALELGHGYVGCEHLLLGMLREEEDAPARALRASGVEEKKTRELITRAVGRGDADLAPSQGLTPHARCAVEMAVTEAERSGSREIESGHLLLGMLRDGGNMAVRLLHREGVDTHRLYGDTVRAMSLTVRRSRAVSRAQAAARAETAKRSQSSRAT